MIFNNKPDQTIDLSVEKNRENDEMYRRILENEMVKISNPKTFQFIVLADRSYDLYLILDSWKLEISPVSLQFD